jgi:xylulokinase
VALVALKDGKVLHRERAPVGLRVLPGGGVEQSPEEWWRATAAACRRLVARAGGDSAVAAVAVTAQWAGTVPVGADGETLCDALIWMDARGAPFVRRAAGGPLRVAGYGPTRSATSSTCATSARGSMRTRRCCSSPRTGSGCG